MMVPRMLAGVRGRYLRFCFSEKPESKLQNEKRDPLDEDEDQPNHYQPQDRSTWLWRINRLLFWGTSALLVFNIYIAKQHYDAGTKTPLEAEQWATPYLVKVGGFLVNTYADLRKRLLEPPNAKLLPDPLHPMFHPKTLVLNLSDTLIKSEYVFGKGMKIIRRPGLNALLEALSKKYEIIVFTDDQYNFVMTTVPLVDPRQRYIAGRFGRESMLYKDSHNVRDLSYLNRDLKKVIVIDTTKKRTIQSENVLVLKQFTGKAEDNDQELMKLLPFLDRLSGPQISSIPNFLKRCGENPLDAFYENYKSKRENSGEKDSGFAM